MNESVIPEWANDIFVAKGLGFESINLRQFVWEYFVSQFEHMDIEEDAVKLEYFSHVVDTLIKNGSIDRAKSKLSTSTVSKTNRQPRNRALKQSALTEFEIKYKDYLDGESFTEPEMSAPDTNIEVLLWDAYMTLDHGDNEERLSMLDKLEKHFSKVGKPTTQS
ncbi:hypothetical protein VIBNISOn1_1840042 [Vibrio nigripulchritudo SOn1]|uniref:Phage protein n=1 Tax=Vibrio nigripulchritudo SOn1 TaxID=1238450 RepID=A0AAV2VPP1_9VIBR|nr:hypothetical protein [Vibrio nigripulchritudo]CCO46659.1 hypothetical protein VIBNISOn1_1840042 [Vibrio nigripulchritudo SOn1]